MYRYIWQLFDPVGRAMGQVSFYALLGAKDLPRGMLGHRDFAGVRCLETSTMLFARHK